MSNLIQWLIFGVLKEKSSLTRREIVDIVGYARSTIYDNLREMEKKGHIERYSEKREIRGRPRVYWRLKGYE